MPKFLYSNMLKDFADDVKVGHCYAIQALCPTLTDTQVIFFPKQLSINRTN